MDMSLRQVPLNDTKPKYLVEPAPFTYASERNYTIPYVLCAQSKKKIKANILFPNPVYLGQRTKLG